MNRLQPDPFEDGYNIAELYREREHRDDEVALVLQEPAVGAER